MVKDRPVQDVANRLRGNKPFTLSRWGDTEWGCMFGERTRQLAHDASQCFMDLQSSLWNVLNSRPPYSLGLCTDDGRCWEVITACDLQPLDWGHDYFPLLEPGCSEIDALVESLMVKPLVIVGPPKMRHLKEQLGFAAFVDVPPKNAYLCRQHLLRETLAVLEDFKQPVVVSVSAGVCAPLLIDDLFKRVGNFHQLVDFGGLWHALE